MTKFKGRNIGGMGIFRHSRDAKFKIFSNHDGLNIVNAPLKPLLKLNNVNNSVSITIFAKSFLDLRLFYVERCLKGGAGTKNFKRGGQSQKGGLNHNT